MRFKVELIQYSSCGNCISGRDTQGNIFNIFSKDNNWEEKEEEGCKLNIEDSQNMAIVPANQTVSKAGTLEWYREAISKDFFILILTSTIIKTLDKQIVKNIIHDVFSYRHMYVIKECTGDITRAVDAYNARQFLNEYRNLVMNTNAYGTTKEEKAPYLRFIDSEDGAFDLLRRYNDNKE